MCEWKNCLELQKGSDEGLQHFRISERLFLIKKFISKINETQELSDM